MSFMSKISSTAAAVVLAAGIAAPASAAVILFDGGTYAIDHGFEGAGVVAASGGAGSWTATFQATSEPINADALVTIGPIQFGTFSGLMIEWISVATSAVLSSINVGVGETTLSTVFSNPDNIDQNLVISWTDSSRGAGFDVEVSVAPVPLPAGGLLLVGALGGLALLRRRKSTDA